MVDLGGNFNGYMGDMSRVFSIGKLPEEAYAEGLPINNKYKYKFSRYDGIY